MKIKVKHKKGKHYSDVKSFLLMLYVIMFRKSFTITMTEENIEKLKLVTDEDLFDWCKIGGRKSLKLTRWVNHWVGSEEQIWVYSIRNGKLAIGDYYRKNGKMDTPNDRYFILEPNVESKPLTPSIYKSIFPIPPYYCGDDSNNNGIGGIAPADFEYTIRVI